MKITMVGHSTVLIETDGMRVLTDPFFGLRGNLIYSRPKPPGMTRADLQHVDLILVSHNHFDHTDREFFKMLSPAITVVAPSISSWVTRLKGASNVRKIKPWQQVQFGSLRITATPAWHSTFTHGFVLESSEETVYFAADTYYGKFMERIASEFRPRVAIMPVTTFRVPLTMGERGAVKAATTLKPEIIIPIHMGISPRNPLLRSGQTPERFVEALARAGSSARTVVLHEGESWVNDTAQRMSA